MYEHRSKVLKCMGMGNRKVIKGTCVEFLEHGASVSPWGDFPLHCRVKPLSSG